MPSRRQFVRASGATAATIATAGVAAAERDAYEPKPDYVSLTYDESELKRTRPYLVTSHLDFKPTKLYAWVATSTERDTRMHCYWAYYLSQHGYTSSDSHQYDREPVYMQVDEDTGDVQRVLVDGYHYLVGTYETPDLVDDAHPTLYVQKPHHFYTETTQEGELVELADMADRYGPWIDNGWDVDQESVVHPWTVESRGHWWKDTAAGVSTNAAYWDTMLGLGQRAGLNIGGAQESDL